MEHLLPSLDHVKEGRSFEAGRTAFRQTGCNQCHRFAGEGGSVGPDLTGVQQRLSARDLLESILLPSKIITEGFAMTDIETKSGDSITGRVESENEREIVIRPPLAPDAVTIRKSDLRRRTLSKT